VTDLSRGAVWVDGDVVDEGAPALRADDHGFLVGDGVFETLRVRSGRPLFLDRHLARLAQALAVTGIAPVPDARLRIAIQEVLGAGGLDDARLRLTITSGPGGNGLLRGATTTVVVAITPLPGPIGAVAPARMVTALGARNERSPLAGIKTTSYADAAALMSRAAAVDADDVLLGDSCDRLSEALTSNVFVVLDGRVLTPGRAAGCLPGIVRDLILDAEIATESDLPLTALADAEEVFLSSSVTGVRPVASIDGRTLPVVDGPATARARRAVATAEADELVVPID